MPAVTLTHLSLTLLLNETVVQHCSLSQIAASMTTIIDFFYLLSLQLHKKVTPTQCFSTTVPHLLKAEMTKDVLKMYLNK